MNSIALVDPAYVPQIDFFPKLELTREKLVATRADLAEFTRSVAGETLLGEERWIRGDGAAPDVRVLIYDPGQRAQALPALLYIHGGGFVMGSADDMDLYCATLAKDVGCVIVSVGYRLAPETPFPGPLEDCYAALQWMHADATALGIDRDSIAIMGTSAGGGLAAGLALLARDRGQVKPKAQILIYPMLDCRTGTPDAPGDNPTTGEFVWTRDKNRFGWDAMRGGYDGNDDRVGYFSPSLAQDLSGLPPAFIGTASLDLFLDENLAYALALSHAGVPMACVVVPGVFHGFENLAGAASTRFRDDLISAIRRLLGIGPVQPADE